jgi:hypothetical protein
MPHSITSPTRRRATRALFALLIAGAACARPAQHASAPAPAPPAVADRLVFGRSIPGGGIVSDAEWDAFVREVITPRFPEGLTLWRAEGQWRDRTGETVREAVVVLELFHPGEAATETALQEIAEEYKRRFRQEAVLRTTAQVRVRLFDD